MSRRVVSVTIPKELRDEARAAGVNMSAVTRLALRREIERRRALKGETTPPVASPE